MTAAPDVTYTAVHICRCGHGLARRTDADAWRCASLLGAEPLVGGGHTQGMPPHSLPAETIQVSTRPRQDTECASSS